MRIESKNEQIYNDINIKNVINIQNGTGKDCAKMSNEKVRREKILKKPKSGTVRKNANI